MCSNAKLVHETRTEGAQTMKNSTKVYKKKYVVVYAHVFRPYNECK